MIKWRIYYDDDTTYSNGDGAWLDAPTHGVVCVVVRDPTEQWGRFVNSGYSPITKERGNLDRRWKTEYYVKYPDDEEPFPTNDLTPFKDRLGKVFMVNNIDSYIKYGRECSQQKWQDINKRAANDPDFPTGTPRRRSSDSI